MMLLTERFLLCSYMGLTQTYTILKGNWWQRGGCLLGIQAQVILWVITYIASGADLNFVA